MIRDYAIRTNQHQVLSSTNGPGFSLNGEFKSDNSPDTASLTGL